MTTTQLDRIMMRRQIQHPTGYSRIGLYDVMCRRDLTKNVKLGPRATGWRECLQKLQGTHGER